MSEEQLKAFIAKVQADTSLQEQLKAAADTNAVAAIAKDAGFMVSVDELKQLSEISEEELENVAGGAGTGCVPGDTRGLLDFSGIVRDMSSCWILAC